MKSRTTTLNYETRAVFERGSVAESKLATITRLEGENSALLLIQHIGHSLACKLDRADFEDLNQTISELLGEW